MTDVLDDTVDEVDKPDEADETDEAIATGDVDSEPEPAAVDERSPSTHRVLAYAIVVPMVLALAALTGWLGLRAYQEHSARELRETFLQVGRQGAINLTTIDFAEADADIQRILDSATGAFYDDFSKRSQPFVEVVKQARSKTVGTVTAAGLESSTDTSAQVIVAVTVDTSNAGAAQQQPRSWRIRLAVQKVGDDVKVSNVEFVP